MISQNEIFKSIWFVDYEGSGPSPVLPSFERENAELPPEISLTPYFKSISRLSPW